MISKIILLSVCSLNVDACYTLDGYAGTTISPANRPYGSSWDPSCTAADSACSGLTRTLTMDVYAPTGDTRAKRPALVMMHGGAFRAGDKLSDHEGDFCAKMASWGIVCCSIDYRLESTWWSAHYTEDAATSRHWENMAVPVVYDARAAVRYLRATADMHIDSDRIGVGGDSAGAMSSLWYHYLVEGSREGDSGNPGHSSYGNVSIIVSGTVGQNVFCHSVCAPITAKGGGCTADNQCMDTTGHWPDASAATRIGQTGGPPYLGLHGTMDTTVPMADGKWAFDNAVKNGMNTGITHSGWVQFEGHGHANDIMGALLGMNGWDPRAEDWWGQVMSFLNEALDLTHAEACISGHRLKEDVFV